MKSLIKSLTLLTIGLSAAYAGAAAPPTVQPLRRLSAVARSAPERFQLKFTYGGPQTAPVVSSVFFVKGGAARMTSFAGMRTRGFYYGNDSLEHWKVGVDKTVMTALLSRLAGSSAAAVPVKSAVLSISLIETAVPANSAEILLDRTAGAALLEVLLGSVVSDKRAAHVFGDLRAAIKP